MRGWVSLAAVLAAALLAGCGGGDGGGSNAGLSHEQLVAKVDDACSKFQAQMKNVEEPESFQGYTEFLQDTHAAVRTLSAKLAALDPGQDDAAAFGKLQDGYARLESMLREMQQANQQGTPRERERLSSAIDRLVSSLQATARQLGATACGG